MSSKLVILPETFAGEGSFSDWLEHFEGIAEVNHWEDADMLLWLRLRLIGQAQMVFKHLDREARQSFKTAVKALSQHFELDTDRGLYAAELGTQTKKPSEDWASFGEDLQALADKAYLELEQAARDMLAVERFLAQLSDPHAICSSDTGVSVYDSRGILCAIQTALFSTQNSALFIRGLVHQVCGYN